MSKKEVKRERSGKKCEAVTKSGRPCSAIAIKGSRYCSFHTENLRGRIDQGRREGGIVRKSWDFKEELPEVETYEDAIKLLNKLKKQVYTKKLPPVIANTLLNITAGLTKLIEMRRVSEGSYLPPRIDEEKIKRVMSHPEGIKALEVITALQNGEELPALPDRLPTPCPEDDTGEAIPAQVASATIQDVVEDQKEVIDVEAEEIEEEEEEKDEQRPTVAFTDTEEFFDMIESQQNLD